MARRCGRRASGRPRRRPGCGPPGQLAPPDLPAGASLFEVPAGGAQVSPETLAAAWPDEEAARRFRIALAVAAPISAALDEGAAPTPLDALAARVLTLHQWRRAVLKATDLPAALRPEGWPGETARARVRDLYWRLFEPSEAWLDACEGAPEGRLPPADPALAARFGGADRAGPR